MATHRLDRRVSRTRRMLRDALMGLILEKGYDAVTIEDITERADLGRTTFYLHYRDKEELLLESIGTIAEELKDRIDQQFSDRILLAEERIISPNPVEMVFHHAAENASLYRIILMAEGTTRVASRMREIASGIAFEFFQRRWPQNQLTSKAKAILEVTAGYFACALLGFITWWLEKNMPYPPGEAADLFMRLFSRGARQVLGEEGLTDAPEIQQPHPNQVDHN